MQGATGKLGHLQRQGRHRHRAQGQGRRALGQRGGILEVLAGPLDCGDQFGAADAAISVGVDQRERALVEVQSARRAAQRDPELLVQVSEIKKIIGAFKTHLVQPAGAGEFPHVFGVGAPNCGTARHQWRVRVPKTT